MVNSLRNRRGGSRLGCLIPLALLGAFVYAGVLFGRPWFAYRQYRDEMVAVVNMSQVISDSAMMVRIRARADSLGLPASAKRVEFRRLQNPPRLEVRAEYTQSVKVPFLGEKVLHFKPSAVEKL
jgi:hypothetical protein